MCPVTYHFLLVLEYLRVEALSLLSLLQRLIQRLKPPAHNTVSVINNREPGIEMFINIYLMYFMN